MTEISKRPSKEDYYLEIAKTVGLRSPCIRRKFGAIIVVNDSIVSTGYNGPARGVVNCEEVGCLKDELEAPSYSDYEYCTAVHAEENAIINAARNGSKIIGGVLYIVAIYPDGGTGESRPCKRCSRAIINSGIIKVVTIDQDKDKITYNPSDWVKKDTEWYLSELKKAGNKKTPPFKKHF